MGRGVVMGGDVCISTGFLVFGFLSWLKSKHLMGVPFLNLMFIILKEEPLSHTHCPSVLPFLYLSVFRFWIFFCGRFTSMGDGIYFVLCLVHIYVMRKCVKNLVGFRS